MNIKKLLLASMCSAAAFTANAETYSNTISTDATIDSSNVATYNGKNLQLTTSGRNSVIDLSAGTELSLVWTNAISPLLLTTGGSGQFTNFNIYGTLNLASTNNFNDGVYIAARCNFNVQSGGVVNITKGNVAMAPNNNSTFSVLDGGKVTISVGGTLYANFATFYGNSDFTGAINLTNSSTCSVKIYDGANVNAPTITALAGNSSGREVKNMCVMDSDTLANTTTTLNKGTAALRTQINYTFTDGKVGASSAVNLGSFIFADNTGINVSVSQGAVLKEFNFADDYTGTAIDSDAMAFLNITNFANGYVQILESGKSIVQDEIGEYFIKFDKGSQDCYVWLNTDATTATGLTYYFDTNGYLNYGIVPEPAAFAAIFGAIAFVFAVRRRRA